jgi:hypothetical protein
MPGNFADKTSGFVVLASLSEGMARCSCRGHEDYLARAAGDRRRYRRFRDLTARRFVSPLDQIELGVAEVINGNIDYTFKPVGQDFEGLSNSLNVMLARLLGREEPNEEAVEEEEEGGTHEVESRGHGHRGNRWQRPAATVAALAEEGEAAYYPRLFNEYLSTLQQAGQPSEGMSVLAFMAKLSLTEAGLREKWECKVVRFLLLCRATRSASARSRSRNSTAWLPSSRLVRTMVQTGLDVVLSAESMADLRGRRVGVLCHPASVDHRLVHIVDALAAASGQPDPAVRPEHGMRGEAQDMIGMGGRSRSTDRDSGDESLRRSRRVVGSDIRRAG